MSSGELMTSNVNFEEETRQIGLLQRTSLGEQNLGTFVPTGQTAEEIEQKAAFAVDEVSKPEYARPASNRWRCVDGRVLPGDDDPQSDAHYEDPQSAGSLVLTDTAIELMINKSPEPVAVIVATKTDEAVADEYEVVVHGGTIHGDEDCLANKKQREVLKDNAANIDVVAPIGWDVGRIVGIDEHLKPEDVTNLIVTGKENADNDALWQEKDANGTVIELTPARKVAIQVEHGAIYEAVAREHNEQAIRVDVSQAAYDEPQFMRDHPQPDGGGGDPLMAFNISMGKLKEEIFKRVLNTGGTPREAALQTMAAILWNISIGKKASNKDMPVAIVGIKTES